MKCLALLSLSLISAVGPADAPRVPPPVYVEPSSDENAPAAKRSLQDSPAPPHSKARVTPAQANGNGKVQRSLEGSPKAADSTGRSPSKVHVAAGYESHASAAPTTKRSVADTASAPSQRSLRDETPKPIGTARSDTSSAPRTRDDVAPTDSRIANTSSAATEVSLPRPLVRTSPTTHRSVRDESPKTPALAQKAPATTRSVRDEAPPKVAAAPTPTSKPSTRSTRDERPATPTLAQSSPTTTRSVRDEAPPKVFVATVPESKPATRSTRDERPAVPALAQSAPTTTRSVRDEAPPKVAIAPVPVSKPAMRSTRDERPAAPALAQSAPTTTRSVRDEAPPKVAVAPVPVSKPAMRSTQDERPVAPALAQAGPAASRSVRDETPSSVAVATMPATKPASRSVGDDRVSLAALPTPARVQRSVVAETAPAKPAKVVVEPGYGVPTKPTATEYVAIPVPRMPARTVAFQPEAPSPSDTKTLKAPQPIAESPVPQPEPLAAIDMEEHGDEPYFDDDFYCDGCPRHCGHFAYCKAVHDTQRHMMGHYPYEVFPWTYYYFRPYNYRYIREQQAQAESWGADPHQPYARGLFDTIYGELEQQFGNGQPEAVPAR